VHDRGVKQPSETAGSSGSPGRSDSHRRAHRLPLPQNIALTPAHIIGLQRVAGNAAVTRMMARPTRHLATPPQIAIQRQEAGSEDCRKLIADKDATVKGLKNAAGYDTGNYYKDVAVRIIEAAERRGVAFDRALYLAAQARAEQSETDPRNTSYRRFNIQVTRRVVEETQGRFARTPPSVIHTTKDGRRYKWLQTVEQGEACTRIGSPVEADGFCHPAAPFYFYDSMEEATHHYLDEMEKGPFGSKGAKDILWSEGPVGGKGGIVEFGNALKRGGYGTDLNYVPKLCDSYNTVVNRMKVILQQAIETKKECKRSNEARIHEIEGDDGQGGRLAEARRTLQEIRRKQDDDRSYKRVCVGMTEEEARAIKEVRRWEGELADRKSELQRVEVMIRTLEDRLRGLPPKEIPCPQLVPVKAAGAAPATH
jgi:hypothetical protein